MHTRQVRNELGLDNDDQQRLDLTFLANKQVKWTHEIYTTIWTKKNTSAGSYTRILDLGNVIKVKNSGNFLLSFTILNAMLRARSFICTTLRLASV